MCGFARDLATGKSRDCQCYKLVSKASGGRDNCPTCQIVQYRERIGGGLGIGPILSRYLVTNALFAGSEAGFSSETASDNCRQMLTAVQGVQYWALHICKMQEVVQAVLASWPSGLLSFSCWLGYQPHNGLE